MTNTLTRLAAALATSLTLASAHAVTVDEVVGTYAVTGLRTEMFQLDGYWKLRSLTISGTVTLNADGTMRGSLVDAGSQMEAGGAATVFNSVKEPLKAKWKIIDDRTLLLGGNRFNLGAGYQVMTSAQANESDHSNSVITLLRQP